jgi:hypothetical protein
VGIPLALAAMARAIQLNPNSCAVDGCGFGFLMLPHLVWRLGILLFLRFLFPRLSKTYTRTTADLVDELDTGGFQRATYRELISGGEPTRLVALSAILFI